MNPAIKPAGLGLLFLFAFVFISPLSSNPIFDEEPSLGAEPLLDEGLFFSTEPLLDEEPILSEEPSSEEEPFLDEEPSLGTEPLPGEEFLFGEESLVFEAPPLIFEVPPFIFEPRSFDEIFPGFSRSQKAIVFTGTGLKHSFEKDGSPMLIPDPASGIDLISSVMAKKPSHIIEALVVVPYNKKELDMLDVYNALGRIENIKDHSILLNNGKDYYIFLETTRLESARNRKSIPDPPPADTLPYSETMYLRFKEVHMGNLYLRGDISMSLYGITYSMTNFTAVRYFILPIMRAERFSAILYLEPIKEGVLIYSMSGLYIPGFIADRVNLTANINNRISVLLSWITDGLRRQENVTAEYENEDTQK